LHDPPDASPYHRNRLDGVCERTTILTTIDVRAHAIIPDALTEMAGAHPDFGPSLVTEDGTLHFLRPLGGSGA